MINRLGQETKPGNRPLILEVLLGRRGLLDKRCNNGILKGFGKKTPFWREKLTSSVNDGRRMSIHLLTRDVGQRSREHVLAGDSLIILRTSISETN